MKFLTAPQSRCFRSPLGEKFIARTHTVVREEIRGKIARNPFSSSLQPSSFPASHLHSCVKHKATVHVVKTKKDFQCLKEMTTQTLSYHRKVLILRGSPHSILVLREYELSSFCLYSFLSVSFLKSRWDVNG